MDLALANPPACAPWLVNRLASGLPLRFFFSQIAWIDQVQVDEKDQVLYRVNKKYGYGNLFWSAAEAFRPITPEEMTPLSPDAVDKRIVVDISHWHNNYGVPTSRGCVNCSPDDAKWLFRWTLPQVDYTPGDVTVGMPGGTLIEVVER